MRLNMRTSNASITGFPLFKNYLFLDAYGKFIQGFIERAPMPPFRKTLRFGLLLCFLIGAACLFLQMHPATAWGQQDETAKDTLDALDEAMKEMDKGDSENKQAEDGKPSAPQAVDDCYQNARFGFSICIPPGELIAQPESDNGDGRRFISQDNRIQLLVWGGHNALDLTIAQAYAEAQAEEGLAVSYKAHKKDWFVVSGIKGGDIVYQRTWLRGDVFFSVRFEYDPGMKQKVDPLLKSVINSATF